MKNWFSRKIHQLHSVMWFLGGFAFGSNSVPIAVLCLVLAIALDAGIAIAISKVQVSSGQTDGTVWWAR